MLVTIPEHQSQKLLLNWVAELRALEWSVAMGRVRGQKRGALPQAVFTWFALRHHSPVSALPGAFQTG